MIARSIAGVLVAGAMLAAAPAKAGGIAGDFDFYVLSLSWSPSYCENADRPDPRQCDLDIPGFVVHGLWPQYEHGYPDYCTATSPRRVPWPVLDEIESFMPSPGLAQYQWEKHGVCSGLQPEAYFDLMAEAVETVRIPPALASPRRDLRTSPSQIEAAFIAANPGLQTRGMAVSCSRNGQIEVRICLDKDLRFRRCAEVDADQCRQPTLVLPRPR